MLNKFIAKLKTTKYSKTNEIHNKLENNFLFIKLQNVVHDVQVNKLPYNALIRFYVNLCVGIVYKVNIVIFFCSFRKTSI